MPSAPIGNEIRAPRRATTVRTQATAPGQITPSTDGMASRFGWRPQTKVNSEENYIDWFNASLPEASSSVTRDVENAMADLSKNRADAAAEMAKMPGEFQNSAALATSQFNTAAQTGLAGLSEDVAQPSQDPMHWNLAANQNASAGAVPFYNQALSAAYEDRQAKLQRAGAEAEDMADYNRAMDIMKMAYSAHQGDLDRQYQEISDKEARDAATRGESARQRERLQDHNWQLEMYDTERQRAAEDADLAAQVAELRQFGFDGTPEEAQRLETGGVMRYALQDLLGDSKTTKGPLGTEFKHESQGLDIKDWVKKYRNRPDVMALVAKQGYVTPEQIQAAMNSQVRGVQAPAG